MTTTAIKPIRTKKAHKEALNRIGELLLTAKPRTPEYDELDVLSTLVMVYEQEHYPIPDVSPIEVIKYVMENRGLVRKDLEPYLGPRGRISDILNGKRQLSLSHIQKLHAGLGIPLECLITTTEVNGVVAA